MGDKIRHEAIVIIPEVSISTLHLCHSQYQKKRSSDSIWVLWLLPPLRQLGKNVCFIMLLAKKEYLYLSIYVPVRRSSIYPLSGMGGGIGRLKV